MSGVVVSTFKDSTLQSIELQVAVAALQMLEPLVAELSVARRAGVTIAVPPEVEAAYVRKHGEQGQHFIDVLRGDAQTIASVCTKVFMRLED